MIDLHYLCNFRDGFQLFFFILAGLFDTSSGAQESSFRRAVTAVNDDRSILTKSLVVAEVGRYKCPLTILLIMCLNHHLSEDTHLMTVSRPVKLCVTSFNLE